MRTADCARVALALAFVALGLLSLGSQDFASVWQPVAADLPGRLAVMTAGGVGLLWRRTLVPAALAMTAYTLAWLLLLHVPRVILAPMHEATWGGCAEILCLVAGCWVLYASTATAEDGPYFAFLASANALRTARIAFAVALPLIGLEHLVYARETAEIVPGWLPYRIGWACATGLAHMAAGMALALNVWPRVAAMLETWMMGGFTMLVWFPSVLHSPTQRFAWTGLWISAVITAATWVVAASYRKTAWLSPDRPPVRKIEAA